MSEFTGTYNTRASLGTGYLTDGSGGWRQSDTKAAQGYYYNKDTSSYFLYQRIGVIYMGDVSDSIPDGSSIQSIELKIKNSGGAAKVEKTLKIRKSAIQGSVNSDSTSPRDYLIDQSGDTDLLGTIKETFTSQGEVDTIVLSSSSNASLFNNLVKYFEGGNNTIVLFNNDESTKWSDNSGGTYTPYTYIVIRSIEMTITYLKPYTVTFKANGGKFSDNTTVQTLTKYEGQDFTIPYYDMSKDSVSSNFTITGAPNNGSSNITQQATKTETFSFSAWNTKTGGSGDSYNYKSKYTTDADITLYAQFTKNDPTYKNNTIGDDWFSISKANAKQATYTVTFNENGGNCSVSSDSVDKIRSYTLDGWYSKDNGSGTKYSKGKAFTSATTLYANWNYTDTTDSITLPLATKDSVSTNFEIIGISEYSSNITNHATKTETFSFSGWNTAAGGSGASYNGGSTYTPSKSITLYAQYTNNSPTYENNTIDGVWFNVSKADTKQATYITTFDSNGGSCDTSSISVDKIRSYTFNGWWSGENGTGTKYSKGKAFTSATTLYANWNYTDTTDSITLPLATRTGYDFLYWNTSSDGTGTEIESPYTPTASDTLYAIYDPKGLIRVYDEKNKKWNEALVFVYTQSGWNQVIPRIYYDKSWNIGV